MGELYNARDTGPDRAVTQRRQTRARRNTTQKFHSYLETEPQRELLDAWNRESPAVKTQRTVIRAIIK